MNSEKDPFDNLVAQLYNIANTQSQPKIDHLAVFYRKIYSNRHKVDTLKNFIEVLCPKENIEYNYKGLYIALKSQKGWGDKTAALFTKSIFHIHSNDYPLHLKIWADVPKMLKTNDEFYLPVDAVIIAIFKYIQSDVNWDFRKVNKELKMHYEGNDIEIWDDLWFWGFITQNGTRDNRKMEWNLNKYWSMTESDKDPNMIAEIESKAGVFLEILNK